MARALRHERRGRGEDTGLSRDSVINLSQALTIDKGLLTGRVGTPPSALLQRVEEDLGLVRTP